MINRGLVIYLNIFFIVVFILTLEILNQVDTGVFDKAGTLTLEQPTIVKIHTVESMESSEVLCYAAGAEKGQTDSVAKVIVQQALVEALVMLEGRGSTL